MQDLSRVFISYHRADSEADAGRLGDTLKRRLGAERVFTDVTDIAFGANWERVVEHTLQGSVALLLVAGPAWKLTDPLTYEVGAALDAGISIVPILVRRASWATLTEALPSKLESLRKFNAVALDHGTWDIDVEPLVKLLDGMLADPARARVICKPPEPVSLLSTALNRRNVRSLLVHAADLAECLDDASVLAEAQKKAAGYAAASLENPGVNEAPPELIYVIGNARSRLMTEQIGRDLLNHSGAEHAARLLLDSALEQEIRSKWEQFEEEKRGWYANRGDGAEDPATCQREAQEVNARARDRLREQLPGLTRDVATRDRLFRLMEDQVRDILAKGRVEDYWEYAILKHFSSYPDKRFELRDDDRPRVRDMLERFKRSTQRPGL